MSKRGLKFNTIKYHPNLGSPLSPKKIISSEKPIINELPLRQRRSRMELQTDLSLRSGGSSKLGLQKDRVSEARRSTTTDPVKSSTTTSASETTSGSSVRTTSTQSYDMNRKSNRYRPNSGNDKPSQGNPANNRFTTITDFKDTSTINVTKFNANDRGVFNTEGSSSPIHYDQSFPCLVHINPSELSSTQLASESRSKLLVNCSNFSSVITNFSSSGIGNPDFNNYFTSLYARYTRDVLRKVKGTLVSSWQQQKLGTYLGQVCAMLEHYFALASILSHDPNLESKLCTSRTMIAYQALFQDMNILVQFDELKKALKGLWFPPKFIELLAWFYQNFKHSDLSQAIMYRYVPNGDYLPYNGALPSTSGVPNIANTIKTAISSFASNSDSVALAAILADAFPAGIIRSLPLSSKDAMYDIHHLETFVNESIIYPDANNTSTLSVYPVIYSGSNYLNDVPYFMGVEPDSNANGLPFALQCLNIPTGSTTGNVYQANYFRGFRAISAYTVNSITCNKWVMDLSTPSSITSKSRANNTNIFLGSGDVHSAVTTATTVALYSSHPLGFQRVYFDNGTAASILNNMVLDDIYGIGA